MQSDYDTKVRATHRVLKLCTIQRALKKIGFPKFMKGRRPAAAEKRTELTLFSFPAWWPTHHHFISEV